MDREEILAVRNLTVHYQNTGLGVENIQFSIARGQVSGILGESGCGKTTVCNAILGLLNDKTTTFEGSVRLAEKDILHLSWSDRSRINGKEIGVILQDPFVSFDPCMRISGHFIETLCTHLSCGRKNALLYGIEMLAKRAKILEKELEWVRSSPKARQAKNKARLQRYEELAAEAERFRKIDTAEINIPPGPRLGSVVLEINGLTKGFGDRVLIKDLSFSLPRAGIVGIIGPNGVGKTTLFKTITGQEEADAGTVKVGDTVSFSYVDQNRAGINAEENVWQVVSDGLDHIKVANFEMPSRAYVASFGFKGPDQQKKAGVLSGGERNRLNLALTLKQGGNVLLLDEPTNDLDVETLSSLEDALLEFPGCAVVISHDRWFLDRTCTHILAWEGNVAEGQWFWFEGNFGDYEKNKVERLGAEAARPSRVTHRKLTR